MQTNSSANVLAIAALEEMRAALVRFQGEAQSAITSSTPEITAARDWLQERLRYWQRELRRREEALEQARRALASCEENCGGLVEAVRRAGQSVQEAQEALRRVQHHMKQVEEAIASFQRQAHRLGEALTSGELPRATALLRNSISILESYISLQAPSGAKSGSSGAPIGSTPASSHGSMLSSLRQMVFAPFASSTLRASAGLLTAAAIAFSSFASPAQPTPDPGMELADQPFAEATRSPAQPVRDVAGKINEIVSGVWDAEQKKAETDAELETIFQQGQKDAQPPE